MLDASATFRKTMTTAEQALYTGISGNLHPLYVNAVHAEAVSGGDMIVFELAIASLATTAFADVGGADCRLASAVTRISLAARIGDTVEATVEAAARPGDRLKMRITCTWATAPSSRAGHAELVRRHRV